MKAYVLTFGGLAALIGALWLVTPPRNGENPAGRDTCGRADMALVVSQRAVRRELLDPGRARFPRAINGRDVVVHRLEPCLFEVRAYVDARNAFGGQLRTRYTVRMRYNPQRATWTPHDLVIR